MTIKVSILNAG